MKKIFAGLIVVIMLVSAVAFARSIDDAVMSKGAKGDEVEAVQNRLHDLGYYNKLIDGDFGNGTEEAVKNFEEHNGLRKDGVLNYEQKYYLFSDFAIAADEENNKLMNTVFDIYSGVYKNGENSYCVINGNSRYVYNFDWKKNNIKYNSISWKPYFKENYYFTFIDNQYCMVCTDNPFLSVDKHTERKMFGIDEDGIYMETYFRDFSLGKLGRNYLTTEFTKEELDEMIKDEMGKYDEFAENFVPFVPKDPEVGMIKSQVEQSTWGKPQKKNISEYKWGTEEQWVYSRNRYIYFSDGIVTAIQKQE